MIIKPLIKAGSIYTSAHLLDYILEINQKAIYEISDINEWKILIDNFEITQSEIINIKDSVIGLYQDIRNWINKEGKLPAHINEISTKWYNTLKSTLYMIEPELIKSGKTTQVYDLWDWFFEQDMIRQDTYIDRLKIIKL